MHPAKFYDFTFRYIEKVLSLNFHFNECLHRCYSNEVRIEIKIAADGKIIALYLDIFISIDTDELLQTRNYNKNDGFQISDFFAVFYPASFQSYGVYISH